MIRNPFAAEATFDALLHPFRVRADHIMEGMSGFLLLICALLAPLRGTWLAWLLIGVPTVLLARFLVRRPPARS